MKYLATSAVHYTTHGIDGLPLECCTLEPTQWFDAAHHVSDQGWWGGLVNLVYC